MLLQLETKMKPNHLDSDANLGRINACLLGIFIREMVQRAMAMTKSGRASYVASVKGTKDDGSDDIVTDVDTTVQAEIVKMIRENTPGFGLIGEENGVNVPCTLQGVNAYFTADPIDGTKAFARRQSSGYGPMIALVINERIVAVCIGDSNTGEMYYYRPNSTQVHRMGNDHIVTRLSDLDFSASLTTQYALLRDRPEKYSPIIQKMIAANGLFKDLEIGSGGIGLSSARLFKREIGAQILRPGKQTPWDTTPVIGLAKMLGFVTVEVTPTGNTTVQDIKPQKTTYRTEHEIIMIHGSNLPELLTWINANK